jgi:hypothetical protein
MGELLGLIERLIQMVVAGAAILTQGYIRPHKPLKRDDYPALSAVRGWD